MIKVNVKGYKDLVTLTGSLLDVPVGSVLLCEGNWKVDARYGQQFIVESWNEVIPASTPTASIAAIDLPPGRSNFARKNATLPRLNHHKEVVTDLEL